MPLTDDTRVQQAEAQIDQFESERYGHELNLARLNSLPQSARDEAWLPTVKASLAAIDQINAAIAATRTAAEAARAGGDVVDLDALRAEVAAAEAE